MKREQQMGKHLLLIGEQRIRPRPGDYSFISSAFDRLPKKVAHAGDFVRFVGYESYSNEQSHVRFFGIETADMRTIPEGMTAWKLDDTEWTAWHKKGGKRTRAWQGEIQWLWFEETSIESPFLGRSTKLLDHLGEFRVRGSKARRSEDNPAGSEFLLFANLHYDLRKDGFEDEIRLVDYDPAWPGQFEEMATWLKTRLGSDLALRIEHYGSTAVPGIQAKPIIDILVEIPSFTEAKKRALPLLDDLTWEYWWYENHIVFFKRSTPMGTRTHHVHMAPQGNGAWEGMAFRDYIRSHPEAAARYSELKRRLAARYRADREGYTDAKAAFVRQATARARQER